MTISLLHPSRGENLSPRETIPFVRLDDSDPELFEELMDAVRNVASHSAFTLGDAVADFEREFASFCQTEHAIGVSSGTEALVLALRALDVGTGDEVIVPSNSFIATAEAVTLVGATPRFADVDPTTGLITAETIEPVVGPRTRCVIPVHLHGATVDMSPISALARSAGMFVVEDACQAHGARIGASRAGAVGDLGCFSFYPTKNLGAWGDGGAVTTADPALAERVRLLRAHGEEPGQRHRHRIAGTTARLDAIQAAVLRVKLRRLEDWNETRRGLGARLAEMLAHLPLELPSPASGGDHVFHLFVVRSDQRDELRQRLQAEGIATAIHYPVPIHLTEAYAGAGAARGTLPIVEALAGSILSLPLWPGMGNATLERLAASVDRAVAPLNGRR